MKRINIFLDDREEKILVDLINKYGGKAPAIIKEALKFRHDKAFPAYNNVRVQGPASPGSAAEPELKTMTQPEACEFFGGKVDMGNLLGKVCLNVTNLGGKFYKAVPLGAFGKETQYGDLTVEDYNVLDEYS